MGKANEFFFGKKITSVFFCCSLFPPEPRLFFQSLLASCYWQNFANNWEKPGFKHYIDCVINIPSYLIAWVNKDLLDFSLKKKKPRSWGYYQAMWFQYLGLQKCHIYETHNNLYRLTMLKVSRYLLWYIDPDVPKCSFANLHFLQSIYTFVS